MLKLDVKSSEWRSFRQVLFGLLSAAIVGGILTLILQAESFPGPIHTFLVVRDIDLSLVDLGRALFQDNIYPFEIAGALLLVAIVAAIALAFRGKQQRLSQNTNAQIARRREDAVRMVKMPSEKK
jgi:NADH-quinone oxidoreductase subunit J